MSYIDKVQIGSTEYDVQDTKTQQMIAGVYSTSGTYAVGDYVTYDGKLYRCVTAIDTAEAWTVAHWTEVTVGGDVADLKSAIQPPVYEIAGKDLSEVFADEDALHDALAAEDYSKIHIGDYYPITLTGEYHDYGTLTCQAGQKYYSDTACTAEIGEADKDYDATAVGNANVIGSAEAYCEVTIGGTKRYCKFDDCLPYRARTLSNAVVNLEIAAINPYWRYGDSGPTSSATPHVVFCARDCLPQSLRMRKANEYWEGMHKDTFTGDGSTAEFTLSGTVGTIGYVWVAGTKKTYNTDYTYASNKVTFKSGKIPTSGQAIVIEWMDGVSPWTGSALYKTLNDPDHGVLKLIQTAYPKLYAHMANMRYGAETRMKTGTQGAAWTNRGLLFLPTEDEVWGRLIYATNASYGWCNQLQWPIFAGSHRRTSKGLGNGASRTNWWECSSYNTTAFASVSNYGNPNNYYASSAYGAALCFLFI